MADEGMSVQIAVRLRPFNDREKKLNTTKCVTMLNQTTIITHPETNEEKSYGFNYCYDSFDPEDPNYASQATVFNDLGTLYLNNAFEGFNCSIFAYGQTGAGKSYSMTGYGKDKGIIPLGLEAMFQRIDENTDESLSFRVEVSYLEIYMEKIRDLFNPKQSVPSLKVRESPKLGVYVDDLKKERVSSYADVDHLMELGNQIRTVAQTNMNATSSRSHSVLTIYFTQTRIDQATMSASDMTSKINLIDLAGSERQSKTGATGDRLKEGSAINQSLTALGNVIESLADKCAYTAKYQAAHGGKLPKKKFVIPYRESKLTHLLKESLGGNAKTIMVAALSPAADNYPETLGTLRYANRASKIKNEAVVNESPNEKVIRELREEVAKLRQLLQSGGIDPEASVGGAEPDEAAIEKAREEARAELEALKAQLAQQNNYIEELKLTKEEQDEQAAARREELANDLQTVVGSVAIDRTKPHLVNLNEDALMSESLAYGLKDGETTFGKDKSCDVVIGGVQILGVHATFVLDGDEVTLIPSDGALVFVRGKKIEGPEVIHQSDRIIFGSNHFFRYNDPKEMARIKQEREEYLKEHPEELDAPPEIFDFRFALEELAANTQVAQVQAREGETQAEASEPMKLEEMLMRTHPEVTEANAIAAAMNRPMVFELKLVKDMSKGMHSAETVPKIKVVHEDDGRESLWDHDKFVDRLYAMKDMYVNFTEYGVTELEEGQTDPFEDPPEDQHIGLAHVLLAGLDECIPVEDLMTPIVDYEGNQMGSLVVDIFPCSPEGNTEDGTYDPDDWAEPGTQMDFIVSVKGAKGLPPKSSNGVYARFRWYDEPDYYETERCAKRTINPTFTHSQQITAEAVTERFLNYLRDEELVFEVWGHADDVKAGDDGNKRGGTPAPVGPSAPKAKKAADVSDSGSGSGSGSAGKKNKNKNNKDNNKKNESTSSSGSDHAAAAPPPGKRRAPSPFASSSSSSGDGGKAAVSAKAEVEVSAKGNESDDDKKNKPGKKDADAKAAKEKKKEDKSSDKGKAKADEDEPAPAEPSDEPAPEEPEQKKSGFCVIL